MSDLTNESPNKRKGLGRGLGSLLGDVTTATPKKETQAPPPASVTNAAAKTATAVVTASVQTEKSQTQKPAAAQEAQQPAAGDKIWTISIEKLRSGKYQPRKTFDKEPLDELARSIKEHGILQPIVARPTGNGQFEIVAGERRWRAAQQAGLHDVPVIIKNFNNQKTLELSLIENLQRRDLNPIEEAEGYQRLISEFLLTQEMVAERVGKERATVANSLRLLKLAPEVRELVQKGQLSSGHAKVLLSIADPILQKRLGLQVTQQQLSVRKLEDLVKQKTAEPKPDQSPTVQSNVTQRLIAGLTDEMQKLLGTRVSIDYNNSKGKMSIYFYSDDELTHIVEKLRNGAQN